MHQWVNEATVDASFPAPASKMEMLLVLEILKRK
jgi:hypothetical protein